ncbi:hypothetical protein [Maridesulfovibrio sp.]|uniref:hypothetical protein n=1 Tax=Maridesulfovibrio sp. TaxID=2795000 RepID=UPI0029C9B8B4|nr:hypothetical protein [Maridesulfovibrio sp.]
MKKIGLCLVIIVALLAPAAGFCAVQDLSVQFSKLSDTEKAIKTLRMEIDKIAGSDTRPDRVYALQDMADMCKTSKMQVHSLSSLFSVVNLVKKEKKFQSREAKLLKKKCGYAFNDFKRRKLFIKDISAKVKEERVQALARRFDAQLKIILEQLSEINSKFE